MLRIVAESTEENKRYTILANARGMIADDAWGDVTFTLAAPDISNEIIDLGCVSNGSNMEGFVRFLELLEICVDEENCEKIVSVFDGMQPFKTILKDASGRQFTCPTGGLLRRLRKYRDSITFPSFSLEKGIRRITLWTTDSWQGKLERWIISQNSEGTRQIEREEM